MSHQLEPRNLARPEARMSPLFNHTVDKLPLCWVSVTCSPESGHRYPWIPALTGLSNCPSPSSEACDTTKIPVTPDICLSWVCCAQTLCALTLSKLTRGFEQCLIHEPDGRKEPNAGKSWLLPPWAIVVKHIKNWEC